MHIMLSSFHFLIYASFLLFSHLRASPSSSSSSSSFDSPTIPLQKLTCRPTGLIQDTSCDYETVDQVNQELRDQLSLAVQLPIFRYHKVDLYRQCPFWNENGLCGNRACAVDELDQDHVPAYWRASGLSNLRTTDSQQIPIKLQDKCVVKEQDYCVLDDDGGVPSSGVYVDLLANTERFTGYAGESAQRVWRAIYEENCFNLADQPQQTPFGPPPLSPYAGLESKPDEASRKGESCLEKRAYYKLLSGLHTSISMHICDEYLDPASGKWVPNLQCYLNRIGLHPERLTNLYFAYTLMLRALSRSASYLNSPRVELCTGDSQVDSQTRQVLSRLIKTAHSYPVTFDETRMFKGNSPKQASLKQEFKQHFRNVSRIMDCVGCDKCRLWGKLQVMGLATALKLLFEYEDGDPKNNDFHLTRPELIAFINTLNRLSESLAAVDKFRKLWERRSVDGTLPLTVADEQFDALTSGEAADAIDLSPGLGPRVGLNLSGGLRNALDGSVAPSDGRQPEMTTDQQEQDIITSKPAQVAEPVLRSTETVKLALHKPPRTSPKSTPSQVASWLASSPPSLSSSDSPPSQPQASLSAPPFYSSLPPPKTRSTTGRDRPSAVSKSAGLTANATDDQVKQTTKQVVVDLGILTRPVSKLLKLIGSRCAKSVTACSHWVEGLLGQVKTMVYMSARLQHHPSGNQGGKDEL